jgi:hypothetical protein
MTGDIMLPLSPREHSILAAIEHDMAEDDPALVATLTTARVPSRHALWFPLTVHQTAVLFLALLVLAVLHSLPSELGLAWSVLLTAGLIVPWLVTVTRAAQRRDVSPSSGLAVARRRDERQADGKADGTDRAVPMGYVAAVVGYVIFVIALGVTHL